MNVTIKLLIFVFASFILAGCESNRSRGGIGHALGAIEISDIRQANKLRDELPGYLNLSDSRIRVEPGSGVTHVTIYEESGLAGRQAIITKLQNLETSNPKLNPIKLLIYPGDESIWSKATLIQR